MYLVMNTGFLFNMSHFWLYGILYLYTFSFERFKKFNLEFIDIIWFYLKIVHDKFKKNAGMSSCYTITKSLCKNVIQWVGVVLMILIKLFVLFFTINCWTVVMILVLTSVLHVCIDLMVS